MSGFRPVREEFLGVSAGTQSTPTGPVILADGGGVTFGMSGSSQVTASVGAGATATGNFGGISAGATSATSGVVAFSAENGVAFGMSNQRITASFDGIRSVSASGGAATGSLVSLANANGVSFGVATNQSVITASVGAGATATGNLGGLSAQGGAVTAGTVVLSSGNNVLFGMNGSTVTASAVPPVLRLYENLPLHATTLSQLPQAMLHIYPFSLKEQVFPGAMTVSTMFLNVSQSVAASAFTRVVSIGFYTMANSTQLGLAFSASSSWGTNAANTAISASMNGLRWVTLNKSQFAVPPELSQTQYWMALWNRSSQGAQSLAFYGGLSHFGSNVRSGLMASGSSTNTSLGWSPFVGQYSASFTTAMPATIAASAVAKIGAHAQFVPHVIFNNMGSNIV